MLTNILFDLDGTLTDPKEGIVRCVCYALKQLGQPLRSELELINLIGLSLHFIFQQLLNSGDNNLIEKAISLYRDRFSKVGLFINEVYPGITELLALLHKNSYKLYVVTLKPKVYAERIVRHFSLDKWFGGVLGPELDEYHRDKIDLIASTLTNFRLVSEETVMIGDR